MDEGHEKLEIYQLAHKLAVKVHQMTMNLPRFELYEEGSQIRRSAKAVSSNIVEGYYLRKYKNEFLHYLHRAFASSKETIEHLHYLHETGSLKDESLYKELLEGYNTLNKMFFRFIQTVEKEHDSPYYLRDAELEDDDLPE